MREYIRRFFVWIHLIPKYPVLRFKALGSIIGREHHECELYLGQTLICKIHREIAVFGILVPAYISYSLAIYIQNASSRKEFVKELKKQLIKYHGFDIDTEQIESAIKDRRKEVAEDARKIISGGFVSMDNCMRDFTKIATEHHKHFVDYLSKMSMKDVVVEDIKESLE